MADSACPRCRHKNPKKGQCSKVSVSGGNGYCRRHAEYYSAKEKRKDRTKEDKAAIAIQARVRGAASRRGGTDKAARPPQPPESDKRQLTRSVRKELEQLQGFSDEALLAAVERRGLQSKVFESAKVRASFLAQFDANDDGVLSAAELDGGLHKFVEAQVSRKYAFGAVQDVIRTDGLAWGPCENPSFR